MGDAKLSLMRLGSGEGKHLHVESRFGQNAIHNNKKINVRSCCASSLLSGRIHFLVPTNSTITAKSNSQGPRLLRAGTKGTLIYYPSCLARRRVYVGIPALPLAFPPPPYRDLFLVQPCTPSNSQRIFFSIFKEVGTGCWGWTRKKKKHHTHSFLPTCTPVSAHLHSVLEMNPGLSRWG